MSNTMNEVPIQKPEPKYLLTNQDVSFGSSIDPLKRMDIFSPDDFELFIELWVTETLIEKYQKIVRCGGAGDMGRDVIAYIKSDDNTAVSWDNYQCKHYGSPLTPSNIWIEIGKLCYFTYIGRYSIPQKYYFVCQKGVGNTLNTLLEKPEELKSEFISGWDKYCKEKISKKNSIELTEELLKHINSIDFSLFSHKTPLELIKSLEGSMSFASIFGGGLKKRRDVPMAPPEKIDTSENIYTEKLFRAYEDNLKKREIVEIDENKLSEYPKFKRHFDRQRVFYFSAVTLLDLERDTRPNNNTFATSLKDEVYDEIIDTIESEFENGFTRVQAVTDRARLMNFSSHPLSGIVRPNDAHGVCHHLANENRIDWVDIYDE
ncbi:hypothetical protein AB2A46_000560 [Listeria innocua]